VVIRVANNVSVVQGHGVRIVRLGPTSAAEARRTFALMAETFGEERGDLSDGYLDALLARPDLWALAAIDGDDVVGGLTAHTLPMTRSETAEIFLYDLAVRPDRQRQGIGRLLVEALRAEAAAAGINEIFVPADDDDAHAIDFYRALGGSPSPVTMFDL